MRDSDRATIQSNIVTHAWADSVYSGLVSRVASAIASHQGDRDAFLRELPIDWTQSPPAFKTIGPYLESEVRGPTESKFNRALDCAVLYFLTGGTNYAACAGDVLHNAVHGLLAVTPSTSAGNGGWVFRDNFLKEARVTGTQLPIIYDFLHGYLQSNPVYDVDAASMVGFDFAAAQDVFRTLYGLARDHGSRESNWSALMSVCMLHSILALDDETERAAALQLFLVDGSSRQASLDYDYRYYTQPGDIWPESLQYASGVGSIRTYEMILLERYDPAFQLFDAYPNLPLSLPRISYLRYPNEDEQICFGDGHRDTTGQPFYDYELVYAHARAGGWTNLTSLYGSLINGGVASGEYDRSALADYATLGRHNEPLHLLWFAPEVGEAATPLEMPRTAALPYAGISLQRNLAPSNSNSIAHGLMCFVGGAAHIHSHASGMSMELYGMGQVMGAKAGRSDYGSTEHENYYRLFAANNTVIVNGGSRGQGGWAGIAINTVQSVAMEPQPFEPAVSSNLSFTCSSFQDVKGALAEAIQQRTMAIVRTSPTSGFYVDFFRSRSTVSNRVGTTLSGSFTNQYHDYLYRNIGVFSGDLETNGVALPLFPQPERFQNDIGDAYQQPGWRYFTNTVVSYPHQAALRARFEAVPSGQGAVFMDVHMPEMALREAATVDSPPIVDAPAPYDSAPAGTLVVRQVGDSWRRPFIAIFEPHAGASGGTVTNATALWRANEVVGVKIESVVNGSNQVHYVLSNPDDDQSYEDPSIGLSFTGRFAVVSDCGSGVYELYLGAGRSLAYRGYAVAARTGANVQASVLCLPGQTPAVTANGEVDILAARAPSFTQMSVSTNDAVVMKVSGARGVPYSLWESTNLSHGAWLLIQNGAVTTEAFLVEETFSTNRSMFYRFTTP